MSFWRMHCKYLFDFLREMFFHIIISPMIIKLFSIHIYKNSIYILLEIWNWSIEYTLVLKQMLLQYAKQYIHICKTSLRCIHFAVEYDGIFVLWYLEKLKLTSGLAVNEVVWFFWKHVFGWLETLKNGIQPSRGYPFLRVPLEGTILPLLCSSAFLNFI